MRLGKYAILNEHTFEVLTKSSEHGIMTIEHLTEFVETDVKHFPWLEEDVKEAKKYLDKKSNKDISRRYCSVCGVAASPSAGEEDACRNCVTLPNNVQRSFISLRSTILEQQEAIDELRNRLDKSR